MPKRIMRSFKLNEISAVDRPAQEHAKIVIMKRDLDGASAEEIDKSIEDLETMETDMSDEDIKKAVDAAVAEATKEVGEKLAETAEKLAKAEADLIKANMTEAEFAFYEKASDTDKYTFFNMTHEVRKDTMTKSLEASIPEHVRKQLEEAAEMKKRLSALEEDKAVASYAKRAADLGLDGHGETLRKAFTSDPEGITKLESILKGLAEQVRTGKVFAEFGSNKSGAGLTVKDEMDAQVATYREGQIKIGKKCSPEQAFTAVYTDPSYADLKKRYDVEEDLKKRRAA